MDARSTMSPQALTSLRLAHVLAFSLSLSTLLAILGFASWSNSSFTSDTSDWLRGSSLIGYNALVTSIVSFAIFSALASSRFRLASAVIVATAGIELVVSLAIVLAGDAVLDSLNAWITRPCYALFKGGILATGMVAAIRLGWLVPLRRGYRRALVRASLITGTIVTALAVSIGSLSFVFEFSGKDAATALVLSLSWLPLGVLLGSAPWLVNDAERRTRASQRGVGVSLVGTMACPVCGADQPFSGQYHYCARCETRVRFIMSEPRCRRCGQSRLYRRGGTCTECGFEARVDNGADARVSAAYPQP